MMILLKKVQLKVLQILQSKRLMKFMIAMVIKRMAVIIK